MWELIGTLVIQLLAGVFIYGRFTERVTNHGDQIKELKVTSTRHEGEIGELFGHAGLRR